jgi:tRNA-2-methylthio-N6-dimethylallyladenosine synthase
VIVGFPSETEEELSDTINTCNAVNFDWIWCHGFSARPGTPASAYPGRLSDQAVLERVSLFQAGINKKESVILDF